MEGEQGEKTKILKLFALFLCFVGTIGRSAINTLEIAIQGLSTLIMPDDMDYEPEETGSQNGKPATTSMVERLQNFKLTAEAVKSAFQKTHLQYDRQGDEHYNLISALHKSMRGG